MSADLKLKNLVRNHYAPNQILSAERLERETAYHRQKIQILNRFVFGSGVIAGLDVKTAGDKVIVSPGLGIDPWGREVLLENPGEAVIESAFLKKAPGKRTGCFYVGLEYQETMEKTALFPLPAGVEEDETMVSTTIRETARITIRNFCPPSVVQRPDLFTKIRNTTKLAEKISHYPLELPEDPWLLLAAVKYTSAPKGFRFQTNITVRRIIR